MNKVITSILKEGERLGSSYTEARYEKAVSQGFLLKNSIPEISACTEREGVGIRMMVAGKLCFCSTDTLTKASLFRIMARAAKAAKASNLVTPSQSRLAVAKKRNAKVRIPAEGMTPEETLAYLTDLDRIAKPLSTRFFSLSSSETLKRVATSEGTEIESTYPAISLFAMGTLGDGSMQRFWQKGSVGGRKEVKAWRMESMLSEDIAAMQRNVAKAEASPKGILDVVAAPEVTGILVHESGGHPYEADRIFGREGAQAGESFITPKVIGSRIAAPCITLVDDPTIEHSAGFYHFDDEGVKARRKFLVKEGIITELLHSRETAAHLKVQSNGSARAASFEREPIPRMSNTFILPRDQGQEELISGVKRGVFIKSFMEWNIDDTRVNQKYVGSEAYLIEGGKLTVPLRQPVIELTTQSLYGSIDAVGKDFQLFSGTCGKGEPMQGIPVSMGGPSIRLRGVRLGVRNG
ncbi:MAG: TldD/PmbA family protein [Nanoarchaeota archaeon]